MAVLHPAPLVAPDPTIIGSRRDAAVVYLRRSPDPLRLYCPGCPRGMLTMEPDPRGKGDMYVCTGGCGQRYWVDLD